MSAPISPSSPIPDPSSVEPGPGFGGAFVFDGAEDLWRSWRDGLTPDPPLTISQWADRHRVLSARASAEPGRYRTDRTPYMRAIMDALSPSHPARRIVFMKAAQVGASEGGNNWIGYVIHHAPGPMLTVQPTVELAKRFSRQRIEPLIAESPALRERVKPARARDAGNTVLSKEFPAGLLVITGANSAVGLRSMPARYLFLDEVDAYPPSADEEGDPVALAEAWKAYPFFTIVVLAGLQSIPPSLYEAAAIDGAGRARRFVDITLPGLQAFLTIASMLAILSAYRNVETILVMTGGGPARSTETLAVRTYTETFVFLSPGTGAAIGMVAVAIALAVIAPALVRLLRVDAK